MLTVGIYGFNITKVTHFSFGTMFPTCKSISEIIKKMKSRDELHLTAFLELDINDANECRDILFHLTAILSFIEQRPVSFGYSLRKHESMGNLDDDYPKLINIAYSIKSTGIIIKEDYYSKKLQKIFYRGCIK